MLTSLLILWSCGGGPDPAPEQPNLAAPVAPIAAALANAVKAASTPDDSWGGLFWRNAIAWKVGGGSVVVGPKTAAEVRTSGDPLVCNGTAAKGAPKNGALVLPTGSPLPEDRSSPAIQAHRVERAAWRLDEALPSRGRFDSKVSSTAPSRQRGVEVGSVTKTRRYGAPPFLIATGVRGCVGAVIFTDPTAERTLTYDTIPGPCTPLRVIPAHDYDGDGNREFAVFNDQHIRAYRVTETPGRLEMSILGSWSCAAANE